MMQIQNAIYNYITKNTLLSVLLPYAKILTFLHPIFMLACGLLTNIGFTSKFLSSCLPIFNIFTTFTYYSYFIGLILSFAKNKMQNIGLSLCIRGTHNLLALILYSFSISNIIIMIINFALGYTAFKTLITKEGDK